MLKKVQADFENYTKRTEKEKQEFTKFACREFVKQLLPLLDSFELALKNTSSKEEFVRGTEKSEISGTSKNSFKEFLAGVELIYSQLIDLLESNQVKKIQAKGKQFDPFLHEALLQEESDDKEGIVLEELQTGYLIGGEVLRHTKVKVAKKK